MSLGTRGAFFYALGSLAAAMLHNLFVTFYVEMFLSVEKISSSWFYAGQAIYCVWNSVNDPVFGWIGDNKAINSQRRISRTKWGGPVWAVATFMLWFHPDRIPSGLWFIIVMIVYDGAHTYTMVAYNALLADMTTSPRERELCNLFSSIGNVVGCGVVFGGHYLWNPDSMWPFRMFALCISIFAGVAFVVSVSNSYVTEPAVDEEPNIAFMRFVRQLSRQPNFVAYAVFCVFQQFTCTFSTNFFTIIMALMAGEKVGKFQQSLMLGAAFIVPHFITMFISGYVLPRADKKGAVNVLIIARLGLAAVGFYVVMRFTQPTAAWLACLLQLACRVLSESICRLQPLIQSDLVDEDTYLNGRSVSLAGSLGGCLSLVSKPAQSLAPVLGCWMLTAKDVTWKSAGMLLFGVHLATAFGLLVAWKMYRLEGRHLQLMQHAKPRREDV
eukprot:PhM_4_TR1354/c0_g1_i1/m.8950